MYHFAKVEKSPVGTTENRQAVSTPADKTAIGVLTPADKTAIGVSTPADKK